MENFRCTAYMPGTTSTALPSFSHDQHHKTDAAKRKGRGTLTHSAFLHVTRLLLMNNEIVQSILSTYTALWTYLQVLNSCTVVWLFAISFGYIMQGCNGAGTRGNVVPVNKCRTTGNAGIRSVPVNFLNSWLAAWVPCTKICRFLLGERQILCMSPY